MNNVCLMGRLTKKPTVGYSQSGLAICKISIAINRGKDANGNDRGADFVPVTVFGKQAQNLEVYTDKGSRVAVTGRIQTGSYKNLDGNITYTVDVIADRVEFIDFKSREGNVAGQKEGAADQNEEAPEFGGFEAAEADIPF